MRTLAFWVVGLLGLVIAFQLAVILGAPVGDFTQGGTQHGIVTTSGRQAAVFSVVLLLVFAGFLLARAGIGPMSKLGQRWVAIGAWIATGYMGIAVILNTITPSVLERMAWAPFSIVEFVLALRLMLRTRAKQR